MPRGDGRTGYGRMIPLDDDDDDDDGMSQMSYMDEVSQPMSQILGDANDNVDDDELDPNFGMSDVPGLSALDPIGGGGASFAFDESVSSTTGASGGGFTFDETSTQAQTQGTDGGGASQLDDRFDALDVSSSASNAGANPNMEATLSAVEASLGKQGKAASASSTGAATSATGACL